MDRSPMDHYEKQLYTVFKTFADKLSETLNKSSLLELCDILQLEEKGVNLVDTLFEQPDDKVTFTQFRDGLLSVLGGEPAPETLSEDDSSGREVSPKFVYGSKKYGRRSKPPLPPTSPRRPLECSPDHAGPLHDARSLAPTTHCETAEGKRRKMNVKAKKCIPMSENQSNKSDSTTVPDVESIHVDLEHDRSIDYTESVVLCQTLRMDGVDTDLVKQIFKDKASSEPKDKMTVGEFFHRLNTSLTTSMVTVSEDATVISSSDAVDSCVGYLPSEEVMTPLVETIRIIDMWERAGIEHCQRLLQELGFTEPVLDPAQLAISLDEELRLLLSDTHATVAIDARSLLLQASLCLHRYELARVKQAMEQVFAENAKVKSDIADANRRAQVLAQEVDESHTKMENSLKNKIKQLETKHAETMRGALSEWATDKERMSATITLQEERAARLTADESRLRAENSALSQNNLELQRRVSLSEERASELEHMHCQLSKELKALTSERSEVKEHNEHGEVEKLAATIEELHLENKCLRDRNDELCAEIEGLGERLTRERRLSLSRSAPQSLDISSEQAASWSEEAENAGERPSKRRGVSPAAVTHSRAEDDSPRVGKLRKKVDEYNGSPRRAIEVALGPNHQGAMECEQDSVSDGPSSLSSIILLQNSQIQDCETSLCHEESYQHRVGNLVTNLLKIQDEIRSVSIKETHSCESCSTLQGIVPKIHGHIQDVLGSLSMDSGVEGERSSAVTAAAETQTDVHSGDAASECVEQLKKQLRDERQKYEEEKSKLTNTCRELEGSLEQMRQEYDKCEEYWSTKLREERDIYSEEQKISDERLGELISKISEYEEQFSPKSDRKSLQTIDEKYSLELQFTDLEEEFERYKNENAVELDEKVKEITLLREQIQQLEREKLLVIAGSHTFKQMPAEESSVPEVSSPIGYLWNQSTIQTPFNKSESTKKEVARDYQNPAFVQFSSSTPPSKCDENIRSSSDGERERCLMSPIKKPDRPRSSSAELLPDTGAREGAEEAWGVMQGRLAAGARGMIHCADLEGQLLRQHPQEAGSLWRQRSAELACAALEQRCQHLQAALRQHQLYLDSVQQMARSESTLLRQKLFGAETAISKLQQRLASADMLVKELYVENCHLAHCEAPRASKLL